jgi:hypothetical protein
MIHLKPPATGDIPMAKTAKLTFRVNARSPKYGYGFHRIQNGWRFDIPWHSLTVFDGGDINKRTIRSNKSGLRWIVENNRKSKTRVAHNIA